VIASIIWRGIDAMDSVAKLNQDSDDHVDSDEPDLEASKHSQHITVGSSLPVTTLAELEREHGDDEAWIGLRKKTGKAFTGYFSRRITFNSHDEVRPQIFRTQFKSVDSF
jgi:hypothetical protein